MKVLIELPDDKAAELSAQARAEGLSLAEWIRRLAVSPPTTAASERNIADLICEIMSDVPPEVAAAMPADGAGQHDHYIYGSPKTVE